MFWSEYLSVLTYFWCIHPKFGKFHDLPRYTVNAVFMTGFRDSVCVFCILEIIGPCWGQSCSAFLYIKKNLFLDPQLLQELCMVFNVDLPCRVKSSQLGIISNKQSSTSAIVKPQPSSCSYICQHCLVHLGDIGELTQDVLLFCS